MSISRLERYGYYDFEALAKKAINGTATQADRLALLAWFDMWGGDYWNGDYYQIDKMHAIRPIYEGIGEADEDGDFEQYILIDGEII